MSQLMGGRWGLFQVVVKYQVKQSAVQQIVVSSDTLKMDVLRTEQ